jgi:catechol 2,3-dioxygenase-like lactoylglutathione lyase family enzyme
MLSMALWIRLDHTIVGVSNWEISNRFYRDVVGAEIVPHGKPPRVAYRLGDTQLNVHGPGLDLSTNVARLPVQPGNSDLCFRWPGPIEDAIAHLAQHGVEVETGPVARPWRQGSRDQRLLPGSRRQPPGIHLVRLAKMTASTCGWTDPGC